MGPNVSLSMRVLVEAGLRFEDLCCDDLLFEELAMAARTTDDGRQATRARSPGALSGVAPPLFLAEAVEPHDLTAAGGLIGDIGRVLGGVGIGRGRHRRHAGR